MSGGFYERKLEGSSVKYYRGGAGDRVDIVEGLIALGANEVTLTAVVARDYSIISVVRCSWIAGEEN